MADVVIWDPTERLLTGIGIILLFVVGILYIYKGRKREGSNEKIMMVGFGSYFIGLAFQRLFGGFFGHYVVPGTWDNTNYRFIGSFDSPGQIFEVLYKVDYVLWAIGAALFILAFEIGVKKTKYVLTVIQIALIIVIIFLPYSGPFMLNARDIQHYIMFPFSTSIIIASIVLLGKWSRIELKVISSILFFGVVFLIISSGTVSKSVKELNIMPMLYLSPVFLIIGSFVVILPLVIDLRYLTHMFRFSLIIGISTIITLGFTAIFLIYNGVGLINALLYIFLLCLVIFLEFKFIKDIKSYNAEEAQITGPIILEMFTKPKRVTEEEVSVSKEKKICLVCKGKIGGINFMCSECGTFYCSKCANALSDLENVCWVCNTPIDSLKPSIPFESEDKSDSKDEKAKEGKKK